MTADFTGNTSTFARKNMLSLVVMTGIEIDEKTEIRAGIGTVDTVESVIEIESVVEAAIDSKETPVMTIVVIVEIVHDLRDVIN
jgi:hypothetical protein